MRSSTPKVLHAIAGRPLLAHVMGACAGAARIAVVVGAGADATAALARAVRSDALIVTQAERNGTGHATRLALGALGSLTGTVLVVPGDSPLLTAGTLTTLVADHEAAGRAVTLLSAVVDEPAGYGRVVREGSQVVRVVEHRDADEQTLQITEINTSAYAFDAQVLVDCLARVTRENVQGEEYLTDVVGLAVAAGHRVGAYTVADSREVLGVNDRGQLAAVGRILRDRLVDAAMRSGVTVVDPASVWLDVDVVLEADVTLLPGVRLHAGTQIAGGAVIGPDTTLTATRVGARATVASSTAVGAVIGADASVGPYSYLRAGAVLGDGAHIGSFVEVKNSEIGDGSKVPHLSYVGDATIGARANIGAATIFCNYDGVDKHRTVVGSDVRIGSDTMLVAPVTIGDGAYTAAGSVITGDVPPGALGVGRAAQRNIAGWVARRRAGTAAAKAAEATGTQPTPEGDGNG
jgi:bifunctional UDP-N-acetylglucosamine pyrophosphorylase / glucosamine-1-phosphate N-acetyltransferase